jgi:hypothetical protein
MAEIVWDYDYIKYTIGSVSEKRTITATHKTTGTTKSFKTRSEFYGHYIKKAGGWLAEYNKGRETPFLVDEFSIEDVQTPEPVEFALNMVKSHINGVLSKLDMSSHYGYIGKGDSWRVGASTILKYKGSRSSALRPIHLDAIEDYLVRHHDATEIRELEADDKVVMDCTADQSLTLVGVDKDYRGCNLTLFNPDKMGEPEKISGFGKLYIGSDKQVRGEGRIFLYHQILSGDSSDEYCANSASDVKWADKSSYAVLSKCSDDKQALQGVVDAYKTLYPTPRKIVGWRGDEIEVDAMYVLQENWTMAHMLRKENDYIVVKDLLSKLNIQH